MPVGNFAHQRFDGRWTLLYTQHTDAVVVNYVVAAYACELNDNDEHARHACLHNRCLVDVNSACSAIRFIARTR